MCRHQQPANAGRDQRPDSTLDEQGNAGEEGFPFERG
jgi:hypothetical protein